MPNHPLNYRYWAVDFDRCLGDVDTLFNHYIEVLRDHHDIDPNEVIAARKKVEASKGSFDLIEYLLKSGLVTDDELELAAREYIKRTTADPRVLMPGARELLVYLESNYRGRYGIVTFGNPYWQQLKIAAAGLAYIPCLVVDSSRKARQIATWYNKATGRYVLPRALQDGAGLNELLVREVILIDDKVIAFDGIHEMTRGYLVSTQAESAAGFMNNSSVDRITDLREIIKCEQRR